MGGMTKVILNPCNCENNSHFEDLGGTDHPYMSAEAGDKEAAFVGPICDECAEGHYIDFLVRKD